MAETSTQLFATPAANVPTAIENHDIVGLVQRIQRFVQELSGSSSSGVSIMSVADQTRLASYLHAMTEYQSWVTKAPLLDLPESNRMLWPVTPLIGVPVVENDSIQDLLRLFHVTCVELLNSQSARLPCNFMPADATRITAIVGKLTDMLASYIKVVDPLDLPASSPEAPMTPQGKTGV